MKKFTVLIAIVAVFMFALSSMAHDITTNGKSKPVDQKSNNLVKPGKSSVATTEADDPILFEDDFENMDAPWIPAANWGTVDGPGGGRAFDPVTNWMLTDANANSGAYSWNAIEGDSEVDILLSPVVSLPTEVTIGDLVSPLKGLRAGHMLDVDTPDGADGGQNGESWQYLIGPVEDWWTISADAASDGAAGYHLDPTHGSTELFWRQTLVTPDIDLSAAAAVALSFKHSYESEPEFDYYAVDVSNDGFVTYTNVGFWEGGPVNWAEENIDLTAFAGQVVAIRFISYGDYGTAQGEWNIDQISVTADGAEVFADGAEEGAVQMMSEGWTSGDTQLGTFSTAAQPTPNWVEFGPAEVEGFNSVIFPGDDIRFGIMWLSDTDDAQGRGLFVDDFVLYGVGLLPQDLGIAGIQGLLTAELGKPFAPAVGVMNEGLDPLSGNVIWTGTITDEMDETVHVLTNAPTPIVDFPRDTVAWLPTLPVRVWTPMESGYYTLAVKVIFPDGDPANQEMTWDVWVPGGPWATPLYRCDFEPTAGQMSLEDFGWTVVNGGGNDLTGANDNKWEYIGFIYGDGAATLSAFWGVVDPGPDVVGTDSSEVLDEYLVSPAIDVSKVGEHNTLGFQFYQYYRPGYGGYDEMGVGWNECTVDWSVDGGATWTNAFTHVDHDSLPGGDRLPHSIPNYNGNYLNPVDIDITAALAAAKMAGSESVWLRLGTHAEDSYFVASSFDELMVYAGVSKPMITAVADIPEDQGKQVHLVFAGSHQDLVFDSPVVGDVVGIPVVEYEVWRGSAMGGAATSSFASFNELFDNVTKPEKGSTFKVEDHHLLWDYVATIPAADHKVYGYVAPTLMDGAETVFMVVARTLVIDVWSMSAPKAGMSEDNLAPGAPTALLVTTQETGGNSLAWEAAYTPVDDVNYYTIYRSETSGSFGEALATTADLMYQDNTVEIGTSYYYVVTASDFAGNESEKSGQGSVVTSVDRDAVPTDYALNQNYPNPFNPTTTVEFALPNAGEVTITVYNTTGQAIQTLYSGYQEAGYHKINWNASATSAGLYFLEMRSANYTKMIKMTLVK